MRPISDPDEWAGEMPATLVAPAASPEERRAALRALAGRVLGSDPAALTIRHEEGRAPRLLVPAAGLHLSIASRGGMAALAVARGPVGIDIERVDLGAEPPWNVLHPAERSWLSGLVAGERELAFARIWAAKEAYLKALGIGVGREPSSFTVLPAPHGDFMTIKDAFAPPRDLSIETGFVGRGSDRYAVAVASVTAGDHRTTG